MDLEPSEAEREVAEVFRRFLDNESTTAAVRAAEPSGFDPDLWKKARGMGVPSMGLRAGEDAASTVQLELVGELFGAALAPMPAVEALAAMRALGDDEEGLALSRKRLGAHSFTALTSGERVVTLAPRPLDASPEQLVPWGALADSLVGTLEGRPVLVERDVADVQTYPRTHGSTSVARWSIRPEELDRCAVALPGDADAMLTAWRVLQSSALVGLSQRALAIAADYVSARTAFGKVIGSFQGVAHPLADSATSISGVRLLVRKAAWSLDRGDLAGARSLSRMAYGFAAEHAMVTTTRAVHVHGGYGSAVEYDIQLFHQRARAWATVAGDPRHELAAVGRDLISASKQPSAGT